MTTGEADDHRLAQSLGRPRQRRAQHGEQRPRDDQDRAAERRAEAKGQRMKQGRRERDEDLAKRKDLHRQGQEREKGARDAAGKQTRGGERPERRRAPACRDRGAGAEPDCDQGCVAQRDDVDDDPTRVHQRQNADDRAIDGDDAEDEADAERPAKRRARPARRAVGDIGCRSAHARFLAMRSPRMP